MKSYEATSTIQASPTAVWAVLTDSANYPQWNTGITRIKGQIGHKETITVYTKISPGQAFPVQVSEFIPPQLMVWSGGMPLGLFKGVRTFSLEKQSENSTKFTMREEFSGLLLPLIWPTMPDLAPAFEQFARDLKQQVETVNSTVNSQS